MQRLTIIYAVMVSLFFHFVCDDAVGAQRPNIVFVLADDLGFETLECYGGTSYKTPHLNQLANRGIRFSHCYSSGRSIM